MATNVEERVLQMKFDNAQFERGIKTSMSSLDSFNKQIKNAEGKKGLIEVADGVNKITNASAGLIAKFAIVTNVVNGAYAAAKNFAKSITIDPVKSGLNEYELKMGSVQTILMGTGESLDVVMDKLEELNKYADRTIYSFQDMTSNIGKFTNAGIKLDVATKAIQGVSNLAAVSGAGAAEASRAMYNISQALGTGYMQLIDWKSIENANMATMEFKQTLIDTAKELGVLNEASNVTAENFRESLNDKWLTNDVLLKTLTKYTDETTELGKKAFAAATEIKTATQLFDVMKESVQSGWAATWENVIGNFEEAKQLFTGIGQVFDFFAGRSADARNSVLKDWKELGGRKAIIQSLYNTFANLLMILKPIKEAFRTVFPPITGKTLADLSKKLADFTGKIWISRDAAEGLKNILTLLLSPIKLIGQGLKIAGSVLKIAAVLVWYLTQSFFALFKSANSVSEILGKVFGDSRFIQMGKSLSSIVGSLKDGVVMLAKSFVELLSKIKDSQVVMDIFSAFKSFFSDAKDNGLNFLVKSLDSLDKLLKSSKTPAEIFSSVLNKISSGGKAAYEFISNLVGKLVDFVRTSGGVLGILSSIGAGIKSIFTPMKVYAKETEAVEGTLTVVNDTANKVEETFGLLSGEMKSGTKVLNGFKAALSKVEVPLEKIKNGVLYAANNVITLLKNLTPAKVLIIGFGTSLIFLVKKVSDMTTSFARFFDSLSGISTSISGIATSISGMFGALTGTISQFKTTIASVGKSIAFEHYTKGIKNLAIAIGILAASVLGLTLAFKYLDVEIKYIAEGAAVVIGLTVAVAALAFAFSKLDTNGKVVANVIALAGVVLSLGISVKLLASAFNSLSYSLEDSQLVEGKIVIMMSLIGSLTLACIALSKWAPKISTGALTIISMAVAMKIMVSAFNSFSEIDPVSFENVIGISGMMVAAGIAFSKLSKFSIKAAVGIGLFTATLLLVPKAISAIENIEIKDPTALFNNFLIFMNGLATFMLASLVAGKNIARAGVGIFAAVSSLIVAADAIKRLAGISPEELALATPILKEFLVIYGLITALSYFSGKNAIKAGVAIQLMSIALIAVVGAIALMTLIYDEFDTKVVNTAAICVGSMMALFGLLTIMTKFAGQVKSITAIVVGVGVILTATALMTLIPTDELTATTKSLMGVMGMFALIMQASSKINWKGALAITVPLIALVGGFILIGKYMNNVNWKSMLSVATSMGIVSIALAKASQEVADIKIDKDLAKKLILFGGVAAVMTGVAVALGKFGKDFMSVDPVQLVASISTLSLLAVALGKTSEILSNAKFDDLKSLGTSLASFLGVAAVMSAVAIALGKLGQEFMAVPFGGLISSAISLGIMANAFASAALVLSYMPDMKSAKDSILSFGVIATAMSGVAILIGNFATDFMKLPFEGLIGGAISLGIMANAFASAALILANMPDMKSLGDSVGSFAAVALSMSVAINIMAPAFQRMADIPWGALVGAGIAISEMAIGMSVATGILSLFASTIENNIKGMIVGSVAMIAIAAACRVLSPAIAELAGLPIPNVLTSLLALTGTLAIVGIAAKALGTNLGEMAKGLLAIGGIVLAIHLLVPAMQKLSEIDFMSTVKGIGALSIALVALGAVAFVMGLLIPQIALGAIAMAAFGLVLKLLVPSLEDLSKLDFMSTVKGVGALAVAIVALGACAGLLGLLVPQILLGSLALGALGLVLMLFIPSLERLQEIDFMDAVGGIGALAVAMVALGGCSALLGSLTPLILAGSVALAALSLTMMLFLPQLERIATFDFATTLDGVLALSTALLALGGCTAILGVLTPLIIAGSIALAGFSLALMLFLPQLEKIANIDFNSTVRGVGAMAIAILGLGACTAILGALFPVMAGGILVLIGFGAAIGVLSLALNLGSTAVINFSNALLLVIPPLMMLSTIDLLSIAGGLALLAISGAALGLAGLLLLPASLGIIAIAMAISTLNTAIENATMLADIFQSGVNLVQNLINGIIEGAGKIGSVAFDVVSGFADGIQKGLQNIWDSGVNMAKEFITGLRSKDGLDSHSPARATYEAATDGVAGFCDGIGDGVSKVRKSGAEMGNEFVEGERVVIEDEQPALAAEAVDAYASSVAEQSDKMEEAGSGGAMASIRGMLDGLKDSFPALSDKIDYVGDFIENKFGSVLGGIDLSDSMKELIERMGIGDLASIFGFGEGEEGEEKNPFDFDFSSIGGGLESAAAGTKASTEEIKDSLEEMRNSIESSMDIFSKFDDTVDVTMNDMLLNIQSQVEGISKWSTDLGKLASSGLDEGFLQTLAEKGTSGYKYVEALQSATAEQIFVYNLMYKQSTQTADAAIEYIKKALPTLTQKISDETGKTIELVGHIVDEEGNIVTATNELIDVNDDVVKSVDKVNYSTEELAKSAENATKSEIELTDVTNTVTESIDGLETQFVELNEGIDETTEIMEDLSGGTEDATSNMDDASKSVENLGDKYSLTTEQMVEFVQGMAKIDSELDAMKKSIKETIESQMNIFEKFDMGEVLDPKELIANMQSQVDAVASWSNKISKLADTGIDEGLLAKLRDMGPEGINYINAFLEMSEEELSKASQLYQDSMIVSDAASEQIIESMRESGRYSVQGLLDGIMERQYEIQEAGLASATAYNEAYKAAEGIHSPSEVQFQNGVNDAQGLIEGIKSMEVHVKNAGASLALKLKNGVMLYASYAIYFRVGQNIDRGLADGIRSMADAVAQEAAAMAKAAYDAACAALGINSPSKMFEEIGMYSDLGLANGLRDYASVVEASSKKVGETALESMQDSINKLNAYAMSDIDDPVIRPILDLSEIQNGVKDMDSLFSTGIHTTASIATDSMRTASEARETQLNGQTKVEQTGAPVYNFTQNNYSPKALDRIAIYRQTNNQFSQLKGLVEGV